MQSKLLSLTNENQIEKFTTNKLKNIPVQNSTFIAQQNKQLYVNNLAITSERLATKFAIKNLFEKDVLNQFKPFKTISLDPWKPSLTIDDQLSIVPLLEKILIANIDKLLEIQFQIDVVTGDLIKLPGNIYVYEFIIKLFQMADPSVYEMLQSLIMVVAPDTYDQKQRQAFYISIFQPILNWIGNTLSSKFGYLIDSLVFWQAISINTKMGVMGNQESVKSANNNNVNQYIQKRLKLGMDPVKQIKGYMAMNIQARKLKQQTKKKFWAELLEDQWMFQKMIKTAIFEQKSVTKNEAQKPTGSS